MIKVGLTGGIGSGKTTVAGLFEEKGIAVYYADTQAKKLMTTDTRLKSDIEKLFGKDAYLSDGSLNKSFIAGKVFGNSTNLEKLNALVHPAVYLHFENWCKLQSSPYVIKEAAILFENGGYQKCDFTILITAPIEVRIQRVVKRDNTTREEVLSRMAAQWGDLKKIALSDCVISNLDMHRIQKDVDRVHKHLIKRINRGWK